MLHRKTVVLVIAVTLSACANISESTDPDDPLESMNRRVFDNNDFVDRLLSRPLAELYRATIPPGVRDCIAGVMSNMKEPVVFVNNLLQGEFGRAGTTIERFGINTTLGVGGAWDVAGEWGLEQQTGDFGQTLAAWGVGEGPYLMLPIFGPSNLRDAFGFGVDIMTSPWQYVVYTQSGATSLIRYEAVYYGADGMIRREQYIETLDTLREGSYDYYAKIRSVSRQYRRGQIGDQQNEVPGD